MQKNDTVADILSRGVAELIDPNSEFGKKLEKKLVGDYPKDIVVKFGVDPTRPDLHLGHAVVLRTLRKLQDAGCKVVFLVGDFTARIGDPSGKSKVRPEVDFAEIEANMKTYLAQVGKILRTEPAVFSWIRNSDWFYTISDIQPKADMAVNMEIGAPDGTKQKVSLPPGTAPWKAVIFEQTRMQKALGAKELTDITLRGFLWTLRHVTHSRLIERDMFRERIKKGEELYMHEMMYPVLQGVDSNVIAKVYGSCDLEIGGTDQTFNMVMGRDVMKMNGQEPQAVLAMKLLVGTDGKDKMSKSLDNYIGVTDTPEDIFGKVMSVPDAAIPEYFELATYTPLSDIDDIKKQLKSKKINPRDLKVRLAREIAAIYHGDAAAKRAEESFSNTFTGSGIPDTAPEVKVPAGTLLVEALEKGKVIESRSDFRRLITEGAISFVGSGEKITDPKFAISKDGNLRVGKHRFVKIRIR